ncbi:MAG: hypothetical protein JXB33_10320 [Clostridia bacterium]|nr:hypothetical protein [Clostridia bacterium]
MKYSEIRKAFLNPEAIDRSAPFWSWNDRMDTAEAKAQASDMIRKGMGGYFMHSRVGLESEYLGSEWMDSVQACVEQAREDGTYAWLYDEDRWPSGAAGGLVTRDIKENWAKGISIRFYGERHPENEILYTYAAVMKEGTIDSFRLLGAGERKDEGETYIHIQLDYVPPSEWYNNTPPADNLNKDTVRKFIETSYEPYRARFGDEFGKTIPGIFTDEPNIASGTAAYDDPDARLPYTYGMPEFFKEKRGYGLEKILPVLFIDSWESKSAKHDYFRTLGQMFAENFSKQLYDWCSKNNIAFTGHWLAENRLGAYILLSGGLMLNYLYQHMPGIDMLRDLTIEFMTIKGCTSVANQTGRKRMLSETYGVSGWQFSFEGQKWIGDYQYVQGINLRCQHLAWYSMRGCRKRDYPPVFNYQTPWWKYNNAVEDYFARIGALTSKGKPVIDTLVLHPLSTAWVNARIRPGDRCLHNMQEETDKLGFLLNDYTRNLMSCHIDFDYGDEEIMALIGGVSDGRLKIGEMEYSTVIIPPGMENLFRTTWDLLIEFLGEGGKIVCEGDIKYIEGIRAESIAELAEHPNFIMSGDVSETAGHLRREVSVRLANGSEAPGIFSMVRDLGGARMLFMINNDRNSPVLATVELSGKGGLEEWDPLTGEISQACREALVDSVRFDVGFGPADSKIFILDKQGAHETVQKDEEIPYGFVKGLGTLCKFERTDENVLVLDMCRFRVEDGRWSGEDEIWRHQAKLRADFGMQSNHLNNEPQRYLWAGKPHVNDGRKLEISFEFQVDETPEHAELVAEDIRDYRIRVNGEIITSEPKGWFVDKCMGRVNLPGLKAGRNEIILECRYMSGTELENIYIIGDFGVSPDRRIIREPEKLSLGDWGLQGYFHYHAGMRYFYDFNYEKAMGSDVILDLGKYNDVVTIVRINGNEKIVPWKVRNRVQVGGMLKPGLNSVEIEVMGAPRNMFGPLHLGNSRELWTGAGAFHPGDDLYTKDYITYPWGLMEQVCIYSR